MSDFIDEQEYDCIEIKGSISELYDSLMNISEEIYRLTGEPQMLITENIIITIAKKEEEEVKA